MSLTPGCPLGLGVLSRVVEEADLTLLPMQKEGSARLSSLRGQKAIVRTLSARPPFLSLSQYLLRSSFVRDDQLGIFLDVTSLSGGCGQSQMVARAKQRPDPGAAGSFARGHGAIQLLWPRRLGRLMRLRSPVLTGLDTYRGKAAIPNRSW